MIKMFIKIVSLWILLLTKKTTSFKIVSWYNGDFDSISDIPFDIYTHIVTGIPILYDNGTVECDKNDNKTYTIANIAHKNNVSVQWRSKFINSDVLFNDSYKYKQKNYFDSLPKALSDCHIDGVELDYEWPNTLGKFGIVTPKMATIYTEFLRDLKKSVGDKIISIDIGVWGLPPGAYPFGVFPWINVSMFNDGAFDFINTMSYHWAKNGNIKSWEFDHYVMEKIWKLDLSRVNLGIPYFSVNSSNLEVYNPIWKNLSKLCPNIGINENICNDVLFVGKQMNYDIGVFAKKNNFGGVFPWALNYDSFENNNTLINWLVSGITST